MLDRLGGYSLAERGLVRMKGKGEQHTYWLLGEDPVMRMQRAEERAVRRSEISRRPRTHPDSNGYPCGGGPRSSLRNKPRSPLARCSSLESPKRLRFASSNMLELHRYQRDPLLEAIADNSPCKKAAPRLLHAADRCSSSCPCIEDYGNKLQLDCKNNSVPVLFPAIQSSAVCSSAPASPCSGSITLDITASSPTTPHPDEGGFLCDELDKPLLEPSSEGTELTDRETPV